LPERDVAAARGIGLRTLRNERQRGDGPPFVKTSKQIWYPESGFREWLKAIERHPVRARKRWRAMAIKFMTAEDRLAERRGVKLFIAGPAGVGKTSQLRTLDPSHGLFVDIEGGDLSVQDLPVASIRIDDWPSLRDIACCVGGPNPSFANDTAYSPAHFQAIGGRLSELSAYHTIFIDSISAASRLCYRHAEQQPEALSRTGAKDVRAAYGILGREMLLLLEQFQRARTKNIVFVAILERVLDDFNRPVIQIQLEGAKTARELPGIVDQIITMEFIDFGDGNPVRSFICTSPNPWNYPAKDRSGRLDQIEEPNLAKLIAKLTGPKQQ